MPFPSHSETIGRINPNKNIPPNTRHLTCPPYCTPRQINSLNGENKIPNITNKGITRRSRASSNRSPATDSIPNTPYKPINVYSNEIGANHTAAIERHST